MANFRFEIPVDGVYSVVATDEAGNSATAQISVHEAPLIGRPALQHGRVVDVDAQQPHLAETFRSLFYFCSWFFDCLYVVWALSLFASSFCFMGMFR